MLDFDLLELDGRAQSPPESWVRVACHFAGLPPPVPQFTVIADGGRIGQVLDNLLGNAVKFSPKGAAIC